MQTQIVELLITWFQKNKRDLPWRQNRSFYRVWISEIMLQQTQVQTVIPYFNRFLNRFPDIYSFARADQQEILKCWEGLGYYNRIKNAQKSAQMIVENNNGIIPEDYDQLIKLPGFGPYTTAAILSFAFKKVHAVVDGNVIRVIARLFARNEDFRQEKNKEIIQSIVSDLIPEDRPDEFNEAVMELGALICTPANPKCSICPIQTQCRSFKENLTEQLPFLAKRKTVPKKQFYAIIMNHHNKYLFVQRPNSEMLGGMWEFPYRSFQSQRQMISQLNKELQLTDKPIKLGLVKHSYSHFKLELIVIVCKIESKIDIKNSEWQTLSDFEKKPSHGANQKVVKLFKKWLQQ